MIKVGIPKNYEIRKARLDDAKGIARVNYESWKTSYPGIVDQDLLDTLVFDELLQFRKQILQESQDIHLVVLCGDTIVGFCDAAVMYFHENQVLSEEQMKKRDERGEIRRIYLLEEHKGKGIGYALFEEARLRLKERGLTPFLLWALKDNKRARAFYERQGGVLVDEISVKLGDRLYPEVAYRFES
ncbi:MAG: GNAT family N-acetyltransferase [Candidatus Nucleicultricaceae bacterium]